MIFCQNEEKDWKKETFCQDLIIARTVCLRFDRKNILIFEYVTFVIRVHTYTQKYNPIIFGKNIFLLTYM